jgi:CHAT domain-containing protein
MGLTTKVLLSKDASEDNVKKTKSPRVMHLATHGFFLPDNDDVRTNPFVKSGIVLANAEKNPDEDGVLTAYEAMELDLEGTDLVVLSACETGLGEQRNGEGVYGLQRAFMVAGAQSIIMSLWKVDDEATKELMIAF